MICFAYFLRPYKVKGQAGASNAGMYMIYLLLIASKRIFSYCIKINRTILRDNT